MSISELASSGNTIEEIPVRISYEIIQLFSEGLYQSPHKAIEELVSNSYDANAEHVHILLPGPQNNGHQLDDPLWVIDDGHGMDKEGFNLLWRIAHSEKAGKDSSGGRAPIGQFGIGKLAAYVLARRLTHISRTNGKLLMTSMDFNRVTGHQFDSSAPVPVALVEIDEDTARAHLKEIEERDPEAWRMMFHESERRESWTAAALSDFKDLYNRLQTGRLRWVLSTGLPLVSDFSMWLNGDKVQSSKANLEPIKTIAINEEISGIGAVEGNASIFTKRLTDGKSDQLGRSHGFFVRVRGRVINLEDELFGMAALNHAAWARFSAEVTINGLQEHLLSSREGVRDSEAIRELREVLKNTFNECRTAYDTWARRQNQELDLMQLLSDGPSTHVTDPLINSVRNTILSGTESLYIGTPPQVDGFDATTWLETFEEQARSEPFKDPTFRDYGPEAPALNYDPNTRNLFMNSRHPFIDKLTFGGKHRGIAKLFASSELLLECQLEENGVSRGAIANLLETRDRVLRLAAGYAASTAQEVIRRLKVAKQDHDALEIAVGTAFQALGFDYEKKGGNAPGPDGILYARLGRHGYTLADYTLVYDAKQTNEPAVAADKINLSGMELFRKQARADFGFFAAPAYQAEENEDGKLNSEINDMTDCKVSLLKVDHLIDLVWLHYKHGVTLTELRTLFQKAHTVPQVEQWLASLKSELCEEGEIPLSVLLSGLEAEKKDVYAVPNIAVVRAKSSELTKFTPERLTARLTAMQQILGHRWIEVDEESLTVKMHQSSEQILTALDRNLRDLQDAEEE